MMRSLLLSALVLAVPQMALAWRAANGTEVNPVSQTTFEVIPHGRSGPSEFWCGAGDFAIRALGTSATQRIYISRAVGPSQTRPGSKAVEFSLSPPPEAEGFQAGYSLSVKSAGDSLDAAMAQRYCFQGRRF